MVGNENTRLVVLRGNSASGKSSVAAGIRDRFGRGLAWVEQDNVRRVVLGERDRPGAANIGLLDLTARYALDAGLRFPRDAERSDSGSDGTHERNIDHGCPQEILA
ncbi:hypothetical protein ABT126_33915, partial [Streptomyces sp. NPDC002012]